MEMETPTISANEALDRIQRILSGNEWDSDTPDCVAHIVRMTGRTVEELTDDYEQSDDE